MTPDAQQPEHCDICEYKSMTGRDGSIQDCSVCDHTPTSKELAWVKKMGCGKHSTRPHIPAPTFPNSTQLIEMAHTEWKNREERRGIHDENDFCAGWITGYLTRQAEAASAATLVERDRIIKLLDKVYDKKYDPRSCNRTDDGGMYNDNELDLILEIQKIIKSGDDI
jgi:hypothetical protein